MLMAVTLFPLQIAVADERDSAGQSSLSEAVAFAPPDTSWVFYTNWDALKAARDLESLDSTVPEDLRLDGMLRLIRDDVVVSGYGLQHLRGHAEAWGWDTTDLAWDAQILADGRPVYVLRFRDDVDLQAFGALLDERGFASRAHGDVVIRSHDLNPGIDWFGTTELAIQNIALLPDGHTAVLSGSAEALEAAVDTAAASTPEAIGETPAGRMAAALDQPTSAAIEIGAEACAQYSWSPLTDEPAADATLLEEVGPLSAWQAMGVGPYATAGDPAPARLLFLAPDADTAAAEAEGRARLASEGHSNVNGEAYTDILFSVDGASAEGDIIGIELTPLDERPRAIVAAIQRLDLLPARCDPS